VVGFWYLLLVLLGGPLRLIYIPNKLFVHDNAAATAGNSPRTSGCSVRHVERLFAPWS